MSHPLIVRGRMTACLAAGRPNAWTTGTCALPDTGRGETASPDARDREHRERAAAALRRHDGGRSAEATATLPGANGVDVGRRAASGSASGRPCRFAAGPVRPSASHCRVFAESLMVGEVAG
ncbi:hypothetical protein GCM10010519_25310 [Streptomyces lactacystinicus]